MNFNEKVKRLEEITDILEKGECELEKAMELFSEGVNLIKDCKLTIKEAKLKVSEYDNKQVQWADWKKISFYFCK